MVNVPIQVAHNGIWIFEAVDVSTEDDGPSPPYESVRYPEITEKYHSLKNVGTGQYMSHISGRLYPSNARGAGDTVSLVIQYLPPVIYHITLSVNSLW